MVAAKNSFQKNDEPIDGFINKKEGFIPKVNSNNELKKSKNKKNKDKKIPKFN